jgi:hypothetical protein
MRNYVSCVKYPIRYECGYRAWYVVREIMIRPTIMLMPQCDIANSGSKQQSIITAALITVMLVINQQLFSFE